MNPSTTPRQLGYRMPAEWEPHRRTWLSWPHNPETWPEAALPRIREFWARMVQELVVGEEVAINVKDEGMEEEARSLLRKMEISLERVKFFHFPTDDAWVRDHGPLFLVRKNSQSPTLAVSDWEYNAWGNKYPPFDRDNAIPKQIAAALDVDCFIPGMVLEGGSIEVNGRGTLLTTEACLLNPNRNPKLTKTQIEKNLSDFLGVRHILWLGKGIVGDDTDGHVDDIVRFVEPSTLICALEEDRSDENYLSLRENYRRLEEMVDQDGKPLRIISLPMPRPVLFQGNRLPASYANFYIGNEVVLVPIFSDPQDEKALAILREIFPKRRVIGLESRELVIGLGGIHCVTQQEPAVL